MSDENPSPSLKGTIVQLPSRAFLQQTGSGKPLPEIRSLDAYLSRSGIPCEWFVEKKLVRRQLPLEAGCFVGGTIPVMREALKQLDRTPSEQEDYPSSLLPFMHRRLWTSTLGEVLAHVDAGGEPVFVKPKGRLKRFTGFVMTTRDDAWNSEGTSMRQIVWCSEVVEWRTEWRIYVTAGAVVDSRRYTGDPDLRPDESVVEACVRNLTESGQGTAGYGLDLGVLRDGRTAVVEWNDGLGLGSYGVEDDVYAELVLSRWNEAMRQPSASS